MTNHPYTIDIAISSFTGVMVAEAIVKPVARRVGKYLIKLIDGRVKILPDWLYNNKD